MVCGTVRAVRVAWWQNAIGSGGPARKNSHAVNATLSSALSSSHSIHSLGRAAAEAENAWKSLSTELSPPAGPVDLLLQDNVDQSNGFAQTFPTNRITIYVVPPVALAELRFHDDWLRLVITHELTHIFHLDLAHGLWRAGRDVFGRNPRIVSQSAAAQLDSGGHGGAL